MANGDGPGLAGTDRSDLAGPRERPPQEGVRLILLGGIELRENGRLVLDHTWPRRKALALVKLLALQPGHALHREQVLQALWPDLTPFAAARNLRKNLQLFRETFGGLGVMSPVIGATSEIVALSPDVSLDVDEFRERARRAHASRTDDTLYEDALALYVGDLLPEDRYEEWTATAREELRGTRNQLLLELAQLWEVHGKHDLTIKRLQQLVEAEPTHEEAQRRLMRAYAFHGDRDRALRQYQQCRQAIESELGVEPGPETEALRETITSGRFPSAGAPLDASAFIGREGEMVELRSALEEAIAGRGRLVMLVGEAGIGKTRLGEELATYARLHDVPVLWGRCLETEGAPAYWPWVQVIRSCVEERSEGAMAPEAINGAQAIGEVVLGTASGVPASLRPGSLTPEQARFRLFEGVAAFLKDASKRRPLMLVLDDLHWADAPSLLLLEFFAREIRDACLLVIGTYRDIDLGRSHPLTRALGELGRERHAETISLLGLAEEDVARFIEAAAGIEPEADLVAAVYQQTEGNPFFISEVVRLLLSEGRLPGSEEGPARTSIVPLGVKRVIGRRLDRLSGDCNAVLSSASAVGRDFNITLVGAVVDLPGERVVNSIQEAIAAGVVHEVSPAAGRYRFSHVLIRDALYDELDGAQRRRLHGRLGEAIERLYASRPEAHLAAMAYHFFLAAPASGADKAIVYARRAADEAIRSFAYEDAVAHLERALQGYELIVPPKEALRCDLLLALGDAQMKAGESAKARETFLVAADVARKLRATRMLGQAALGFAGPWVGAGFAGPHVVRLLEEACDALADEEEALRAMLLARLAVELQYTAPLEQRAALGNDAVEAAQRSSDTAALAYALNGQYYAIWSPGNVEERLEIALAMLDLAEAAGDRELALQGRHWRMLGLLELGDVSAVDREIAAYATLAEELRQPVHLYRVAARRAMRALLDGRFDEAERLIPEAFAIGRRAQDPNAVQEFTAQLFALRREQGRLEELRSPLESFVQQFPAMPGWRCALANLYAELGQESRARAEIDRLAAGDFKEIPEDANWLTAITLASQACAAIGHVEGAARLYTLLKPHAGRTVVAGAGAACNGACSHHLGLLASTTARWREAISHFEQALAMHTAMGAWPWLARTQYEFARALLRRAGPGDRATAFDLASRAREAAEDLGMRPLAQKIAALTEDRYDSSSHSPIEVLVSAVESEKPDLRRHASPDGTVTMLFTDIEGSTAKNEALGDAKWMAVLRAHNAVVRDQTQRHRGYEVKAQGDGFMVAFDSARRALECAIAIQRTLAERAREEPDLTVGVRMGLHAGEAVKEAADFFGRTVNLAARIAGRARAGEILASSVVRALAKGVDGIVFDQGRDVALRGVAEKQRLFSVTWIESDHDHTKRE